MLEESLLWLAGLGTWSNQRKITEESNFIHWEQNYSSRFFRIIQEFVLWLGNKMWLNFYRFLIYKENSILQTVTGK